MTPIQDIIITLELGEHHRSISCALLAHTLGIPEIRNALLRLLTNNYPQPIHNTHTQDIPNESSKNWEGEGDIGDEGGRDRGEGTKEGQYQNFYQAFVTREEKEKGSGGKPRGGGSPADDDPAMMLATELASRLADPGSLAWYVIVARSVPWRVIDHALTRALEIRRSELRRSRAAYFAGIVRPHLQAHGKNPRPTL